MFTFYAFHGINYQEKFTWNTIFISVDNLEFLYKELPIFYTQSTYNVIPRANVKLLIHRINYFKKLIWNTFFITDISINNWKGD